MSKDHIASRRTFLALLWTGLAFGAIELAQSVYERYHRYMLRRSDDPKSRVYVIAAPCVKSGECVDACPVDAIHPRKDEPNFKKVTQLYINPKECIACTGCLYVCPNRAIFTVNHLPEKWKKFETINASYFKQPRR